MKSLFIFSIFVFSMDSYGYSQIIFNPGKLTLGRQLVASESYEAIKIDSNKDGKVDFWSVKSGTTIVTVYFKNDRTEKIIARKLDSQHAFEYIYNFNNKGMLVRTHSIKRPKLTMHLSSSFASCSSKLKNLHDQLAPLKKTIEDDVLYKSIENDLIDKDCQNKLDEKSYENLTRAIFNSLNPEIDFLGKCISSDKILPFYGQDEESKLGLEILRASYDLQRYRLIQNSSTFKPTFRCNLKSSSSESLCGLTSEGQTISLPPNSPPNSCDFMDTIPHELLHRSGIVKDQDLRNLIEICENIDNPSFSFSKNRKGELPPPLVGNAAAANITAAQKSSANISSETSSTITPLAKQDGNPIETASQDLTAAIPAEMTVQQSGVPSVAALSASLNSPYPMTDDGAEAALKASKALSAPLLAKANNLLGAMNSSALAKTSTLASGPKIKTKGLAPDERIVEQITLDDNTPSTVPSPTTTFNGKTPLTEVSKLESPAGKNLPGQSANELKSSPDSFAAGPAGGSRSPASIGGQIKSSNSTSLANGKAASGPQRQSPSVSPDEVITFISRANYATAKEKLKDSSFTQRLSSQGITILDLNGNTYGAKKGTVIFLDEGNRFVRQK